MIDRNVKTTVFFQQCPLPTIGAIRFLLLIFAILSLICLSSKLNAAQDLFTATLDIDSILTSEPEGTPGRRENEFKLNATASAVILQKNQYILGKIRTVLEKSFNNDLLWQVPPLSGSPYYIMEIGLGTFCFLDIYLDTEDGLNAANGISYRVRYRWHSRSALFRYLLGSSNPVDFPHRCEYQLKVYDKEWHEGFNDCLETRFEFRNASKPFKKEKSAPPAPWPFTEFIKPAITGKYGDYAVITTHDYAKTLKERLGKTGKIVLRPSLIIATTRRRLHLGIKNEFGPLAAKLGMGSTTNADNAILITLDTAEIYRTDFLDTAMVCLYARDHNSLTKRLQKRLKINLKPVTTFTELEFEFERNIESALAYKLEQATATAEKDRLSRMKKAFLEDLQTTSRIVAKEMAEIGIKTEPGRHSKYQQSFSIIKNIR